MSILNRLAKIADSVYSDRDNRIYDSNVERIYKWVTEKEVATITAFRSNGLHNIRDPKKTLTKSVLTGKPLSLTTSEPVTKKSVPEISKAENRARNRALKTALLDLKYGVTPIVGFYYEERSDGTKERVKEESFFVVNLLDDPNFFDNVFELSEWFNQDCFCYKPKDSDDFVLVGTNNAKSPEYGERFNLGSFNKNVVAENMSRIGNVGMAFGSKDDPESDIKDDPEPQSWKTRKEERTDAHRLGPKEVERFMVRDRKAYHGCSGALGISLHAREYRDSNLLPPKNK